MIDPAQHSTDDDSIGEESAKQVLSRSAQLMRQSHAIGARNSVFLTSSLPWRAGVSKSHLEARPTSTACSLFALFCFSRPPAPHENFTYLP